MSQTPPSLPILVLVETEGPANLGAVARCAAAYNVTDLRLVSPRCEVDEQSRMWACYGKPLLENLTVHDELNDALNGVGIAVALTRRDGKRRHRHHYLAEFCQQVWPRYQSGGPLALVFGNEVSGLANHHLAACQYSAEIPTLSPGGSLNLSHAVGVTLYEVLGRPLQQEPEAAEPSEHEQPAGEERLQLLLEAAQTTLGQAGYPRHRSTLEEEIAKLKDIVLRSHLEEWEVRLLLGMMKQVRYRFAHPEVNS